MKYYTFGYDWDKFPRGGGILGSGGDMDKESEQLIIEKFWDAYCKKIKDETKMQDLSLNLNYLKYRPSRKFLNEDLLDNLFGIGIVVSSRFKNLIQKCRLGNHDFIEATIEFRKKFISGYSFFYSKTRNYNIINFEKSWFYEVESFKAKSQPELHKNSLIKIADEKELLYKINNNTLSPVYYELVLKNEPILDIIDLGDIENTFRIFNFSERIVNEIIKEEISNIIFSPNERIKCID